MFKWFRTIFSEGVPAVLHLLFVRTCFTVQVKSLYHDAWAIIMHLYAGSRSYILITNVEAEDLNKCFLKSAVDNPVCNANKARGYF